MGQQHDKDKVETNDEDRWVVPPASGVRVSIDPDMADTIRVEQHNPYGLQDPSEAEPGVVMIGSDQVDRVIQFLQEAKQELKKKQSSQR
ncbi:hypothetical protein [Myxococcus virescens]|uniref:Uncharacterized protein n=1 Tax=Myxococcus virescens TaxID=83456 RepID=A0A511HP67_9BACT|nr:hypothetical protein [Myxococcus virescens]GEL75383.1 hypothetical protein MVI01_71670 [Myxococcus virescens]SDE65641.1 hypothetical protein SAMN04488504_109297 [Myxococcus virescens]